MEIPGRKLTLSRSRLQRDCRVVKSRRLFETKAKHRVAFRRQRGTRSECARGWHTDAQYLAPYGYPRDLKIDGTDVVPTFEDLCGDLDGCPSRSIDRGTGQGRSSASVGGWRVFALQKRTYIPTDIPPDDSDFFSSGTEIHRNC